MTGQKIASNSDCFLVTPCHAHVAYFTQDERSKRNPMKLKPFVLSLSKHERLKSTVLSVTPVRLWIDYFNGYGFALLLDGVWEQPARL